MVAAIGCEFGHRRHLQAMAMGTHRLVSPTSPHAHILGYLRPSEWGGGCQGGRGGGPAAMGTPTRGSHDGTVPLSCPHPAVLPPCSVPAPLGTHIRDTPGCPQGCIQPWGRVCPQGDGWARGHISVPALCPLCHPPMCHCHLSIWPPPRPRCHPQGVTALSPLSLQVTTAQVPLCCHCHHPKCHHSVTTVPPQVSLSCSYHHPKCHHPVPAVIPSATTLSPLSATTLSLLSLPKCHHPVPPTLLSVTTPHYCCYLPLSVTALSLLSPLQVSLLHPLYHPLSTTALSLLSP